MLDIAYIRENPDSLKKAVAAKKVDSQIVDQVLELDEKRRQILAEIEGLRADRNRLTQGISGKPDTAVIEQGKVLKNKIHELENQYTEFNSAYNQKLSELPNLPLSDVKPGRDESENEIMRSWGKPRQFNFPVKDHLELGENLGLIDVERAGKVSGSRFAYILGEAVLLEMALVRFALDKLIPQGFMPILPPSLIKTESMRGMGYMEHGGAEDMYVLDKDKLVLVGTAEHALGPMHRDEIIPAQKLPLRYAGFSPSFRREAGSYGKDTRGILRVHQFDKVEMFSFVHPDKSDAEHEFLLGIEESLLQELEIPYQVVKMCTGDLGFPAARKYDLEAWMPGQNRYREVTSASTVTDFQARRLNIRYQEGSKIDYLHMLNGTAFAIGRMLIAILENYQNADGSITVPEVLRPFIGKEKITGK